MAKVVEFQDMLLILFSNYFENSGASQKGPPEVPCIHMPNITYGFYIYYPIFEDHFFVFLKILSLLQYSKGQ